MNFNVALLQISPAGSDQDKNLSIGLASCRKAKSLGADLAVFPELWSIGCSGAPLHDDGRRDWLASAISQQSSFVQAFADLARKINLNIAITFLETHQPLPRNSTCIFDSTGEVALQYSKVFICNFGQDEVSKSNPQPEEIGCDFNCSPGDSFNICTLQGARAQARIGAMICADREFPLPANQLMLNGAEIIVVPNACNWDEIRSAGLKTRAFENLVGIAMVNYPSPKNNGHSQAHTCVAWRNGQPANTLIANAGENEEIILAPFDVDEIRAFRKKEEWRLNYLRSRPLIR
ncbi:MAG TPA: carbon-nitrogen hydrolase family protein [Candidatus Angelobacter sp.]|nr:carbon-nitrogen hydrolase family protein [Candidatus Angelobacter sp.]HKT49527.1 carbon-nitrogen hydrolase family protein [Candidatus Angelobacter sp.]